MSESSAAWDSVWGIGPGISLGCVGIGSGDGIRRGGSRTKPPDEVVRTPELRVENFDRSGEKFETFRLRAVVEPGVERLEFVLGLDGGEVVWLP